MRRFSAISRELGLQANSIHQNDSWVIFPSRPMPRPKDLTRLSILAVARREPVDVTNAAKIKKPWIRHSRDPAHRRAGYPKIKACVSLRTATCSIFRVFLVYLSRARSAREEIWGAVEML